MEQGARNRQLIPIALINPALAGLNKAQESATTLGPPWALEARNCYFDTANRLAARKGWGPQGSALAGAPRFEQTFEYYKADGDTVVISAADNKLYAGASAYTDVTGAITPPGNSWQFVNFVDEVIGAHEGIPLVSWNGLGNFSAITATSGTVPTSGAVCAAFGRIWAADADGNSIKYCGLLDKTNWGAAGSGSINMRSIWTRGTDRVVGIYAAGSKLVVFGNYHIVLFVDGSGSEIGLDPAQIIVGDTIEGTGLVARDSVQSINEGDLLYLSPHGMQSLSRTIVQKNSPLYSLDSQVRDYVNTYVVNETKSSIRSVFSNSDRFYLLLLPTSGRVFCYDTLFPMQDGRLRVTEWTYQDQRPASAVYRRNGQLLFGMAGRLGLYTGYVDNQDSYRYTFNSSQLSVGPDFENHLKILKRIGYVLFTSATLDVILKWGYDFAGLTNTAVFTVDGGITPEYGTAEYGESGTYNVSDPTAVAGVNYSEYGGSVLLKLGQQPGSGTGRWLQIGVEAEINGGAFAIQELDAFTKIGRMT